MDQGVFRQVLTRSELGVEAIPLSEFSRETRPKEEGPKWQGKRVWSVGLNEGFIRQKCGWEQSPLQEDRLYTTGSFWSQCSESVTEMI